MNYCRNKAANTFAVTASALLGMSASVQAASKVEPADAICEAYASMQYPLARTLIKKHPDLQEARLVKALTAVFDRRKQDIEYGLPELKEIYEDNSFKEPLRIQAGLAYARAGQTLQMRSQSGAAGDVDYNKIYDEIIAAHMDKPEACFAIVYKVSEMFDSESPETRNAGITELENFIPRYKGTKNVLAGMYMLLADQYIINSDNYAIAVKYLIKALDSGIANPRTREGAMFSVARIYDTKLHDKVMATKYYNQFLKEYPNSGSAPVVRRYLQEMDASSSVAEVKNG
jgi:hypothetical protein